MKILYVSVDNRCRSILAEAITKHVSEGLVAAYSAGTQPDKSIYPAVYGFLRERDIETLELQTKSIMQLGEKIDNDKFDIVVLMSPEFDHSEIADKFPNSKIVVLPIEDISHSSASDAQLHEYFENIVDTIEFRLRKAIIESEKPASSSRGRFIEDEEKFIQVFCDIAQEKLGEVSAAKNDDGEHKYGDNDKAKKNAQKNEEQERAQTVKKKNIEKTKD